MRRGRGGGPRGSRLGSGPIDDFKSDESETPEVIADSENPSKAKSSKDEKVGTAQIEYLIHQSTLGIHFIFDRKDVARVMMVPTDEKEFFTLKNMERVQSLLSKLLEKSTIIEKERYMKSLGAMERDLLIRAYFHLVENSIQSNFELKH